SELFWRCCGAALAPLWPGCRGNQTQFRLCLQDYVEPIYFYIGTVFGLQAVCVTALFVCSWVMSGTCVAGMLAVSWFVLNRQDATRVEQGIPLRENWALPYFSVQVAALTGFLSNNISSASEMFCYLTMSASTFTFLLLWEHGHYVLFVQGLCLFLLDSLDLVPQRKTADINKIYLSSLVLVYLFQFQNSALLASPLLCLLIGSAVARSFQRKMRMGPLLARVMKLLLHFHLVFTAGISFAYLIKKLSPVGSSDFTLKLLEVKFGLNTTTDFVTNFLLCQDGLRAAGQNLFLRLTQTSVLPFYVLVLAVCLLSTLQTVCRKLRSTANHQSLILSTAVPTIIGFSLWREYYPRVLADLADLQEFYDPDTTELIGWIRSQAPAVFAGSPLLLGTIKLCSGSAVTSLPIYSDMDLLRRSEETYQVYSMRSAEDVYKCLTAQKTTYVIVEESICNDVQLKKGCRLKDLLDVSNRHVVHDGSRMFSSSKHGRFCQEVKMNYSPYTNYFTRVFWNRSYHVYKVNSVISFQF
ncbi:PREDICTED: probable C-mannosyltransferase DPY19L4, partial [Cyprinodon variegatus]|uniref:probable C-mannosyltransferase DPY19L4 n=1 Tax=Cyprinodon variegatus TaxID=28743 RepID=UPI000742B6CA